MYSASDMIVANRVMKQVIIILFHIHMIFVIIRRFMMCSKKIFLFCIFYEQNIFINNAEWLDYF